MNFTVSVLGAESRLKDRADLRIMGIDDDQRLYKRGFRNLFEQVGETTTVEESKKAALELFGVPEDDWEEVADPIGDLMKAYAQKAIEIARDRYSVELDLSEKSLDHVERILGRMYKERPKGLKKFFNRNLKDPIEEEMPLLMHAFGGYIGEVINRNITRGAWRVEYDRYPGEAIITLRVGETDMYPPIKVVQRLFYGRDDNILNYYDRLKAQWSKGKL